MITTKSFNIEPKKGLKRDKPWVIISTRFVRSPVNLPYWHIFTTLERIIIDFFFENVSNSEYFSDFSGIPKEEFRSLSNR